MKFSGSWCSAQWSAMICALAAARNADRADALGTAHT